MKIVGVRATHFLHSLATVSLDALTTIASRCAAVWQYDILSSPIFPSCMCVFPFGVDWNKIGSSSIESLPSDMAPDKEDELSESEFSTRLLSKDCQRISSLMECLIWASGLRIVSESLLKDHGGGPRRAASNFPHAGTQCELSPKASRHVRASHHFSLCLPGCGQLRSAGISRPRAGSLLTW